MEGIFHGWGRQIKVRVVVAIEVLRDKGFPIDHAHSRAMLF
jgi:hypothetical protein